MNKTRVRLAALLPPAPLKNRLPQPETPDRLLPESETVILAVPTVGPDGMLRTPTVPERYPLAECLRLLPERAVVWHPAPMTVARMVCVPRR